MVKPPPRTRGEPHRSGPKIIEELRRTGEQIRKDEGSGTLALASGDKQAARLVHQSGWHKDSELFMSEIERRKEPFVPDPNRMVYPVDPVTSQQAALAKFQAEILIEVGAQLATRTVDRAADLEDQIRMRSRDEAHYGQLAMVLMGFLADAIEVRHQYMTRRCQE